MKRKSHQRITKIKLDQILELLKKAENTSVEDACTIEPAKDQLTPYPDMNNLRTWTRDYLTKGLNKILINKLDTDGQTYMTTLIDGLPLFTKMSKTISFKKYSDSYIFSDQVTTYNNVAIDPATGIITYPQSNSKLFIPTPTSIWANGKFSITFRLSDLKGGPYIFYMGFRDSEGSFTGHSRGYISSKNETLNISFNNSTEFKSPQLSANTWYTFSFSLDSSYNITLNLISENGTKLIDNQLYHQKLATNNTTLYVGYLYDQNFQVDATKCSFGNESQTIKLYKTTQTESEINTETSKPGLWLSNLIQPVSGSQAGSWLRSNLIHSNEDKYSLINSYVVGNYSNTFTQPALILSPSNQDNADDMCPRKRKFPVTTDWVYYNQHYSPCISSCINYVNQPDNHSYFSFPITYFEYKYGSYQTIAFPVDPDMQTYTETDSTCLNYNFTNPSDNETAYNATLYSMQAANSNQKPEPINSLVLKPNGATGGSVSGTLTSFDDEGNKCETNINYIFRSVQAMFSTDYEYVTSDNSLDNTSIKPKKAYSRLSACCYYHYEWLDSVGWWLIGSGNYRFRYTAKMEPGYSCRGVAYQNPDGTYSYGMSSGNNSASYNTTTGGSATCGADSSSPSVDYDSNGYCGSYRGRLDGYIIRSDSDLSGQSGLNIYLHVKDLAAESRSKGIPFVNPDCTQPSFQVYVNTDATPKDFEKVYLIAENVSIDALGNIDTINEKIIKLT